MFDNANNPAMPSAINSFISPLPSWQSALHTWCHFMSLDHDPFLFHVLSQKVLYQTPSPLFLLPFVARYQLLHPNSVLVLSSSFLFLLLYLFHFLVLVQLVLVVVLVLAQLVLAQAVVVQVVVLQASLRHQFSLNYFVMMRIEHYKGIRFH